MRVRCVSVSANTVGRCAGPEAGVEHWISPAPLRSFFSSFGRLVSLASLLPLAGLLAFSGFICLCLADVSRARLSTTFCAYPSPRLRAFPPMQRAWAAALSVWITLWIWVPTTRAAANQTLDDTSFGWLFEPPVCAASCDGSLPGIPRAWYVCQICGACSQR